MTKSRWRPHAATVIFKVITDNPGLDEKAMRKKISAEYPFGERDYHPYKIWLSEVKNQLGIHFRPEPITRPIEDLPLFGGSE